MTQHAFLIQTASGQLARKTRAEMGPEDEFVFDGPDAFASADAFQAWVEAQIESAGGLDQWRAQVQRDGLPELPEGLRPANR